MSSLINSRFQNRDFANQLTSNKNHMAFVYKFVIPFTRWKTEKGYYQYQRADTNHCDCVTSFTFNAVLTSQFHFILNTVLYKYSFVEQWSTKKKKKDAECFAPWLTMEIINFLCYIFIIFNLLYIFKS